MQRSPELSKRPLTFAWSPLLAVRGEAVPSSRSRHASCLHGNQIYVYGGKVGNVVSKELWVYNLNDGVWKLLQCHGTPPPSPQEHSMIAYKGRIFVFGAEFNFSEESPLWILDLEKFQWKRHSLLSEVTTPESRRGHTAVVCNSGMHIFGGYVDLKGSSQELWTFDLESLMWHLAPSSDDGPGGRHDHSAVMYDGCMYVFGGMNGLQTKDDLWSWHFARRKWTKIRCYHGPPPLKGHCACRVDDTMLVFGGSHGNFALYDDLWSFSFNSQTWTKVLCSGTPPSARSHLSCLLMIPSLSRSSPPTPRPHSVPSLKPPPKEHARPSSSPADINPKESKFKKKKIFPDVELCQVQLKNKRNYTQVSSGRKLAHTKQGGFHLWASYGSLTSTHDQLPMSSSVDSLLMPRSTLSLESLIDVNTREWIQPRSYSRQDLILEDVEDSEDDLLDSSRSELLLHTSANREQTLGRCNDMFAETSFIEEKVVSILPANAWVAKEESAGKKTSHCVYPCTAMAKPVLPSVSPQPMSYCIYFFGGVDSDCRCSYGSQPLVLWKLNVSLGSKKS